MYLQCHCVFYVEEERKKNKAATWQVSNYIYVRMDVVDWSEFKFCLHAIYLLGREVVPILPSLLETPTVLAFT